MPLRALVKRALRRLRGRSRSGALRGSVDGLQAGALSGWASTGGEPLAVELRHGETVVVRTVAVRERPDVEAAGAAPLRCGFSFSLAEAAVAASERGDGGAHPLRVYVGEAELATPAPAVSPRDLVDAAALSWALGGVG